MVTGGSGFFNIGTGSAITICDLALSGRDGQRPQPLPRLLCLHPLPAS